MTQGRVAEVDADAALDATSGAALVGVLVPGSGAQGLVQGLVGTRTVSAAARLVLFSRQRAGRVPG